MGITTSCECGTRVRVKEELAGKQVQCPRCSRKITVPILAKLAESIATDFKSQSVNTIEAKCKCGKLIRVGTKYAGRKAKCPQCQTIISIPFAGHSVDDPLPVSNEPDLSAKSPFDSEFDELLSNVKPMAAPSSGCPRCSAVMPAEAVLCVTCGYHRQVGARLRTKVDRQIARGAESPSNISVDEEPRQLKIHVRGELPNSRFIVTLFLFLFLLLLFLGLVSLLALGNIPQLHHFVSFLKFFLSSFFFLPLIYFLVASFVNSTTYLITSDSISINCGPVPWPIFTKQVSVDEIKQVYIVKKRRPRLPSKKLSEFGILLYIMTIMERGLIAEIYDINIVKKNGWRFRLFSINNEATEVENRFAWWLENKIKFTLSLPDVPVISTWYQRYLHFETTQDDEKEVKSNDAISAKSWWVPQFMLPIVGLFLVFMIGSFKVNDKTVDLSNTRVTDEGLKELAARTKLTELNLSYTRVTDAGLKELTKLTNLTTLGLDGTQVTDGGLKELAALTKLNALFLEETQVTDAGLKELAKLTNLTFLDLGSTQVTDAGLSELTKLTNLNILCLDSTKVTDAGLKKLAPLKNLKELCLETTAVTDTGVKELKQALPNCVIFNR